MVLQKYKMKLNPVKYTFGIESGKFLDFIVSRRGIEANSEKTQAIINMKSPKTLNEVHKLAGRIATLNIFVFKCYERSTSGTKSAKKRSLYSENTRINLTF